MRLDTSQQMRTDMRLRMAPRMIQSMEILQLPLDGLAGEDRPGADREPRPANSANRPPPSRSPRTTPRPTRQVDPGDEQVAEPDDDWDDFGEIHRPSRAALSEEADRKHDAMQNMASRPRSLHDDLADQIGFLDCDPTVRALAEYIIHNLDENGFLNLDLNEVVRDFGGEATMPRPRRRSALVQKLDPPGVGARNLKECLLLQLTPETPMPRRPADARSPTTSTTSSRTACRRSRRRRGCRSTSIKEAIEHLRRLNPRPGAAVRRRTTPSMSSPT